MLVMVHASELLAASKIASKNNALSAICSVLVKRDGNRYAIVATDSYKLVVFENDDINGLNDSEDGSVLIEADFIKSNIKAADGKVLIKTDESGEVTLNIYAKKGAVRTMITKNVESKYPNYEQLIEKDNEATSNEVAFNADFMKEICDCASKAYGKGTTVQMAVKSDIKPIEFHARGNDKGAMRAVLMPVRI